MELLDITILWNTLFIFKIYAKMYMSIYKEFTYLLKIIEIDFSEYVLSAKKLENTH